MIKKNNDNNIESKTNNTTKRLGISSSKIIISICVTGMMLALALVFDKLTSFIPFLDMPQGGHISLSILPLVILALFTGPLYGLIGSISFAFLNFLIDGGAVISLWSLLLDYILAFGLIGLVGFFHPLVYNKKHRYIYLVALLIASLFRFFFSGLSGALIFGEYAPEGINPWFYSFVLYNLPYIGASLAANIVFILPLIKPMELLLQNNNFASLKPKNLK